MRFMNQRFPRNVLRTLWCATWLTTFGMFGQAAAEKPEPSIVRQVPYALILSDPPAAQTLPRGMWQGKERLTATVEDARAKVRAAQSTLRATLAERQVRVLHATDTLVNAVYVMATDEEARELRALPGVVGLQKMRTARLRTNRASQLVNAPAGWVLVGGESNAGAGRRIAIIDTGIDQTHPVFQDPTLTMPAGFPKCVGSDCDFTSTKVIAARSYVSILVGAGDAAFSRPDDLSPRDRVGHGTAAASVAAALRTQGPAVQVVGIAPKAYLGNYKIFGSPGVNDVAFENAVIKALEDAYNDGMDVASLSFGFTAVFGPYDTCGNNNSACDISADAIRVASQRGMPIVVSAGNNGDISAKAPTLQTIDSPATADEAISVGASTNSHEFFYQLRISGDAPSNLQSINALFGNGPKPGGPFTANLRDVSQLDNDGTACLPLTRGVLSGSIGLIRRGGCDFLTKVLNAQQAGARAVAIYNNTTGDDVIFAATGLDNTGIPMMLIGNTTGSALRQFVANRNNSYPGTLDPTLVERNATADEIALFSSQGPTIREFTIKPDLVAPGTDLYMATQNFDPNGDLFDATRYVNAAGTSFSAPMVAGAIAVNRQRTPNLTAEQLRSVLVNTANPNVVDGVYSSGTRSVLSSGGGKLDLEASLRTNITSVPATLSLRNPNSSGFFSSQSFTLTNIGNGSVSLVLTIVPRTGLNPGLVVSPTSVTLAPGAARQVTFSLPATPRQNGIYEGVVRVSGASVPFNIPYLFVLGDAVPFDIYPVYSPTFTAPVNRLVPDFLGFKLIDQFGRSISGSNVSWRVNQGGGTISSTDTRTDALGIAATRFTVGQNIGVQEVQATAGGLTVVFPGRSISELSVFTNGIVNAASNQLGNGIAPGSYISIYGRGLSDSTRFLTQTSLPLSMSQVSVSFDVASQQLSYPGRLSFVSDGQVNVQVPWELAGQSSVQIKVSLGDFSTAVQTVKVQSFSPAAFEYQEGGTDRIYAAALDAQGVLLGSNNKAKKGQVIQIYANGLGPVSNRPASGEASPGAGRLAICQTTPTITIGGQQASVQFAGLSPGSIALYQINVVVPPGVASGTQPLVISMGGQTSKTSNIPIE